MTLQPGETWSRELPILPAALPLLADPERLSDFLRLRWYVLLLRLGFLLWFFAAIQTPNDGLCVMRPCAMFGTVWRCAFGAV